MQPTDVKPDGGFALISVLWFSLLLSLLGACFLREGSATRMLAATGMARLQAQAVADGAINLTILQLIASDDRSSLPGDRSKTVLRFAGRNVALGIEREVGKIDVNTANAPLLTALFRYGGATMADAEAIAAGVITWRTPSDGSDHGVDLPYLDAGRAYGPRRGPFRSCAELRLVLGMTDALQTAVEPLTTIWSPDANINRSASSDDVLELLASVGDSLAAVERSKRHSALPHGEGGSVHDETVTISAQVVSDVLRVERQAVIRFTNERTKPFAILDWH